MNKLSKNKGKLVTIMGVTNVGKTTQMEILEKRLITQGLSFKMLKYPIYDLAPTGPQIHAVLKQGNPENLSAKQLQELCAQNRKDFEPRLEELLSDTDIIIAEMYTGTGIAYGMGDGLEKDFLLEINQGLIEPDISVLLDGNRYLESIESGHRFETDDEKTNKIRKIHLELGNDLNWTIINANQDRAVIADQIWKEIEKNL